MNMSFAPVLLYWEKQISSLCGVHCLNTLLQGPYFTEIDLAQVAQSFDEKEKQLMMESGMESNDFLKYMAEESGNVADDGNYSIQVLSEALKNIADVTMFPVDHPQVAGVLSNPTNEKAFICNLREHWFTILHVNGVWYNLNSLNKAGPEVISEFYLSAFLNALKLEGYSIFVVRGQLPSAPPDIFADSLADNQRLVSTADVGRSGVAHLNSPVASVVSSVRDDDLEAAIKASLSDTQQQQHATQQGSNVNPNQLQNSSTADSNINNGSEEDQELMAAIALSNQLSSQSLLASIPPEPAADEPDTLFVQIRLRNGTKIQRRFRTSDTVKMLYTFVEASAPDHSRSEIDLMAQFPSKCLADDDMELNQFGNQVVLFVRPKPSAAT
eukprot:GILK01010662.1.p1 GENE.GILK01010662.1~~GILK01010662.1.p1  ORF type:complete len:384 (+),score=73.87 GILK01010662.1:33-1184(+)